MDWGEALSIRAASSLWFHNDPQEETAGGEGKNPVDKPDPQHGEPPNGGDDNRGCHDEDQEYWDMSIQEYADSTKLGPEIASPIAGASKIFLGKTTERGISQE